MVARGLTVLYLAVRTNRVHHLLERYWLGEVDQGLSAHKKSYIRGLLRTAQVPEAKVAYIDPVGFGRFVEGHASLADNMLTRRPEVIPLARVAMMEAEGYYRDEVRRSLVPVFWPSVLAHLPSDLLVVVGVNPGSVATRAATAIGWIATVVASVVGVWAIVA